MATNKVLILGVLSCCACVMLYHHKKPSVIPSGDPVLIIGISAGRAGYAIIQHDTLVGFDVDIIREMVARLGKRMILKEDADDNLQAALAHGAVHLAIGGSVQTSDDATYVWPSLNVAVSPQYSELRAHVQQVLSSMERDGVVWRLKKAWGIG